MQAAAEERDAAVKELGQAIQQLQAEREKVEQLQEQVQQGEAAIVEIVEREACLQMHGRAHGHMH